MTPASLNLTIRRSIAFDMQISAIDSNGAAVDLTGYTVVAKARASYGATEVLFDFSPTISDAPNGVITVAMTDETTTALTAGSGVWDIVLQDGAGKRIGPLAQGTVTIKDVVSRP